MLLPESCRLDELWLVPRERASLRFHRVPRPFSPKTFLWKNFFIGVDDCLKGWERLGPAAPPRARGRGGAPVARGAAGRARRARRDLPGHDQCRPRAAGARLSRRSSADPGPDQGDRGARASRPRTLLHYQPCVSPVWDTALAVNALVESGLPADHPQLQRGGRVDDRQADHGAGRLAGQAPARAAGRLAVPVRQRLLSRPRRHGHGPDGAAPRPRDSSPSAGGARSTAGLAWFLGMQGSRRRLGLLRRRQQPAHLQQHPVRRPRRPARPVHRGPDRPRPRAAGHARRAARATPRPGARSPSSGAPSTTTGPGTAAGASTTSTARGRCCAGWAPSARTARRSMSGAPSPGSRRARTPTAAGARRSAPTTRPSWPGAASRFRARRHGRSWRLFAAGRTDGTGRRARHPVPLRHPERRTAPGRIRSGTARASRASSISSTTCTPSTSRSGPWASIGARAVVTGRAAAAP